MVDGVQRNPVWTNLILRSYARNVSTLAKKANIYKDVAANADSMTLVTMNAYLNALEKLFVIEDIDAWCLAIRSATTIRAGYGLEADAVLHLNDGRYALIEFKLGSREIEEGARHLLEILNLVRKYNEKEKQVPLREPDLLIIITGGEMAYCRADGVKVIPIGTLRN